MRTGLRFLIVSLALFGMIAPMAVIQSCNGSDNVVEGGRDGSDGGGDQGADQVGDQGDPSGDPGDQSDGRNGDEGGDEAGDKDQMPFEEFCTQVVELYCGQMVNCLPGVTAADCKYLIPMDCGNLPSFLDRTVIDSDKAAECLDELTRLGCDAAAGPGSTCLEVVKGSQKLGQACAQSAECVSGLFCQGAPGAPCGVCKPAATEGQSCAGTGECVEGLYCDRTEKCVRQPRKGEVCTLDESGDEEVPCAGGLFQKGQFCKPDSEGARTGKCTSRGIQGALCGREEDCFFVYYCGVGKCVLKPRTGEDCSYNPDNWAGAYTVCLFGAFSGGDFCRLGQTPGSGKCVPVPGVDEKCGGENQVYFCQSGLWCTDTLGGGTCQRQGAIGEPCNTKNFGMDCRSGECTATGVGDAGKCAEAPTCQ